MRNIAITILMISALAIAAVGCGKDNPTEEPEAEWEFGRDLQVAMQAAGYDTRDIKLDIGRAGTYYNMPTGEAIIWCGHKKDTPWIGLSHFTGNDHNNLVFDREIEFKFQQADPKITENLGYGQTKEFVLDGIYAWASLWDDEFAYLWIFDHYSNGEDYRLENGATYIYKGGEFQGVIKDMPSHQGYQSGVNIGYDHDYLFNDICYSKDGTKLYDIKASNFWSMELSGNYFTYPLNHELFLTLCYYPALGAVEVVLINLKTEERFITERISINGDGTEKVTGITLKSHQGDICTVEYNFMQYSGSTFTRTFTIDVAKYTASIE